MTISILFLLYFLWIYSGEPNSQAMECFFPCWAQRNVHMPAQFCILHIIAYTSRNWFGMFNKCPQKARKAIKTVLPLVFFLNVLKQSFYVYNVANINKAFVARSAQSAEWHAN